jgi:hypothetical protein
MMQEIEPPNMNVVSLLQIAIDKGYYICAT